MTPRVAVLSPPEDPVHRRTWVGEEPGETKGPMNSEWASLGKRWLVEATYFTTGWAPRVMGLAPWISMGGAKSTMRSNIAGP